MKKTDSQHCGKGSSAENQQNTNDTEAQQAATQEIKDKQPATDADKNTGVIAQLEEKLAEANDRYLRLVAEFDNYRKRTLKEKMDMLKNGGEDVVRGLLPTLDDLDRSVTAIRQTSEVDAIREGILLIQNKLLSYLTQQGLAEIDAQGKELDTDLHDAVTTTPTNSKADKGKVVDVIQKGYKLNDKVIRHSKVVVGE